MKKPTLCCCFTWIVFIELNFTVAFLLIRKTWDDRFAGKLGKGMGSFQKLGRVLVDAFLRAMFNIYAHASFMGEFFFCVCVFSG